MLLVFASLLLLRTCTVTGNASTESCTNTSTNTVIKPNVPQPSGTSGKCIFTLTELNNRTLIKRCSQNLISLTLPRSCLKNITDEINDSCLVKLLHSRYYGVNDTLYYQLLAEYLAVTFPVRIRLPDFVNTFIYLCANTEMMEKARNEGSGYVADKLNNCAKNFMEMCIIRGINIQYVSTCFNQLYLLCRFHTNDNKEECKEKVEEFIDDTIVDLCDEEVNDHCGNILDGILQQPLRFNSINRVTSILQSKSRRSQRARSLFNQTATVINEFEKDVNDISGLIDYSDVKALLSIMDNALNSSHLSVLSETFQSSAGPMVLNQCRQFSRIFSKAILSNNGRIKSNFSFFGNNLDIQYKVPSENDSIFSHKSGNMEALVRLPKQAICQNKGNTKKMMSSNIGRDNNDTDDIRDRYRNCFPNNIPQKCQYVISSFVTRNVETYFEAFSNSTLISLLVTTQVISSNVSVNDTSTTRLKENITLIFNISENFNRTQGRPVCHFWNTSTSTWSTDGVITLPVSEDSNQVTCLSNHLTTFAVLVDHTGSLKNSQDEDKVESKALNVVSYIGCVLSILSLIVTIILLIVLRKQLQKGPILYIHINLSAALLMALLLFVIGIDSPKSIPWLCSVVAGLLHYLFLCVFCWSLCEGIMLYILLVKVYGSLADRWYLLLPIGWGLPVIIVGISAGVRPHLYGTSSYCWLSFAEEMIWSFIGPMILIIVINTFFLLMTLYQIIRSRKYGGAEPNMKNTSLVKSTIKGIIILLPLLGITWIIGVFTVNDQTTVFLWIFTILNTLQGVAILYLHVLRNKIVTQWIKEKLFAKCKSKRTKFSAKVIITNETILNSSENGKNRNGDLPPIDDSGDVTNNSNL